MRLGEARLQGPWWRLLLFFPKGYCNPRFKDSKQLSARKRELLFEEIKREAVSWSIVAVGHRRIEKLNILQAARLAMSLAVRRIKADLVLVDGNQPIETELPQHTIVNGDALRVEITAASILAKVWRDRLMCRLNNKYPGYGFNKHAGYPTKAHREAIATHGPCPIHRRTFRGVKEFLDVSQDYRYLEKDQKDALSLPG